MKNTFNASGTQYTVTAKWIALLNFNINGSTPLASTKNGFILPKGSTVTMVKQVTNNHKIPFLYFTVNNPKQVQKKGTVSGNVTSSQQFVAPLSHFSATKSANGLNADGAKNVTAENFNFKKPVE